MFKPIFHVNLGLGYEYIGKKSEALQAYYEALNWDENNQAAKKGIERLEEKKKGLFSRFFGGGK